MSLHVQLDALARARQDDLLREAELDRLARACRRSAGPRYPAAARVRARIGWALVELGLRLAVAGPGR
jgi:hypothetical protein